MGGNVEKVWEAAGAAKNLYKEDFAAKYYKGNYYSRAVQLQSIFLVDGAGKKDGGQELLTEECEI